MRTAGVVAVGLFAVVASHAAGADTGIGALKLVLRESGSGEKLVFVSKDPAAPFPAIGSADDPAGGTPGGMTIDLVTAGGVATIEVPAGAAWTAGDGVRDVYRFKNPLAPAGPSPARTVVVREGRVLKIVAKDMPLALTGGLGPIGVRVVMGGTRICARFDAETIVSDQDGAFVARDAVTAPVDCSEPALGLVTECGNGVLEFGEACDGAGDAACPGRCLADCSCEPYCGDGMIDTGEECDGSEFGTAVACTAELGLAAPMCQANCTCCALLACSAFLFDAPCCPGLGCPPRIGPNDISFCEPLCSGPEDCQEGQICFGSFCRTPNCSSSADCGLGICVGGICCFDFGSGFVCP